MSILLMTPEIEERIKEIVAYASDSLNWYRPKDAFSKVPGDKPDHVLRSGDTRIVFSWTVGDKGIYRHLSVSVQSPLYPNPVVVWTLAHKFGFTGAQVDQHDIVHDPSKDWDFTALEIEHCVVVTQLVPEASERH